VADEGIIVVDFFHLLHTRFGATTAHNNRHASLPPSRFLVPFSRALGNLVDSGFSF
jgi:hypothetical protein